MLITMKNYAFTSLFCILLLNSSLGAIKNGYEREIISARQSLSALNALLSASKTLTTSEQLLLKTKINQHVDFISNYELTAHLLEQFSLISPELYYEIDTIIDKKGRTVDVYVKFVRANLLPEPLSALTSVQQHEKDEHCHMSEYGLNTVSIRIAIEKKSLRLLAHEFGHVKYIIPNLSEYLKYSIPYSKSVRHNSNHFGHYPGDPSGLTAQSYESKFRIEYFKFVKNENSQTLNPVAILQRTKKGLIKGVTFKF